MAKYKITTKSGESYLVESPRELSNQELEMYAENPAAEAPEPQRTKVEEPLKTDPPTLRERQLEKVEKDRFDLSGLYERSVSRGQSVYEPTAIGSALKQRPGTIGEAIAGTPERAARLALATGGTVADAAGTLGKIAVRGLVGEKPGEVATAAIQKTGLPELVAPAIKKYQEFKNDLDPASRANIGAAESGLSALGTFGGIKTGENVAKRLVGEGSVLKESGPKGVVKALVDPLKNETGAISPNKPYTIPDIDDITDVEDAAKSVVDLPKNMGEIKKNIGQPPKKGIRNYALTVDEQEFLSKPESLTETPFPVVMQQASLAKQKRFEGVLTPLDKAAADKGGEALKLISSKKSEIGKIKGDLVDAADDYLISTNQFADATPIQQRFVELVRDRLGAQFDDKGRLVDAAGRIMNDSAEKTLVMKMARTINKLRPETTLKELDDVVMDLRNMVEHKKSSQTKQIFTKADGIGETVRGDIKSLMDDYLENSVNWGGADDFLGKEGVATLKGSLRDYANIAKIEDRLNRGLGEVVDPVTGQAKMGASLLKSSLMSNSDRGTKALFRAVNDLTGIDLMKEAAKAEIAMKAVGDDRINDLLKEAGAIRSLAQGDKAGALLKLGEKAAQKWTGEKPDQLLRYYYKHHPDAEMVITEPKSETIGEVLSSKGVSKLESKKEKPTIGDALKRTLGNERGAVGANLKSNLSDDDLSEIASSSDNMGYNLSIEDKKETMGPVISKLKKKGITHIDAYHITNGDIESIKKDGLHGSELDYTGKPSGYLRERSVYLFLDPSDIKKGQEYLKTSSKESPVVHIKIPVEKLTNLNWDPNFNLTAGSYTAERFSGNIPKDWIQGVHDTKPETIGSALKNERGAVGGASDSFVGTPAIRDPETGKIYLGGWRGHKDAITKGETSAIQERLKYQHFLDNSNKPTDNVGFIDKNGNFVSRSEAEANVAKPKTPAQLYHDEWGKVGSKKGDKYSALKTLAATGTAAAGALTIGESIKAKKKK